MLKAIFERLQRIHCLLRPNPRGCCCRWYCSHSVGCSRAGRVAFFRARVTAAGDGSNHEHCAPCGMQSATYGPGEKALPPNGTREQIEDDQSDTWVATSGNPARRPWHQDDATLPIHPMTTGSAVPAGNEVLGDRCKTSRTNCPKSVMAAKSMRGSGAGRVRDPPKTSFLFCHRSAAHGLHLAA